MTAFKKTTEIKMKTILLPLHISVNILPHLFVLHLAAPVRLPTTSRHRRCALWSGETGGGGGKEELRPP